MKRQIRRGVFETNSSSTHSLTMCLKSDYDRWTNGEVLLFKGPGWYCDENWCYDENNKPLKNHFYTKEECINFVKSSKYPPSEDMDWEDRDSVTEYFRENEFYDGEYTDDELEWFEDEFITPSGEKVIAFGEFGYQ